MKNIALLATILLCLSCAKDKTFTPAAHIPSKIDSLKNEAQVETYIRAIDTTLREFYLVDYSKIITHNLPHIDSITHIYAKELGVNKTFYKEDFNNDGYTDLLLIGGWPTGNIKPYHLYQFNTQVVMNRGKNKSTTYSLVRDYNFPFVPQIVRTDSLPLLVLHHPQNFDTVYPPRPDTLQVKLVCKSNQFVEYNRKPIKNHSIEKIEFATGDWESAPVFQMVLNQEGDSWFIAIHDNFEKNQWNEGTFKSQIKAPDFEELCGLLNYIDFENLREDYSIFNTGPPSEALRITYDNGKVKEIYNNAGAGTYGMMAIYNKLAELRFSQEWKQAKEPKGIRLPGPERRNKWKA